MNEETFPLGSMVTYQFPARPAAPQANNCHVTGLEGAGGRRGRHAALQAGLVRRGLAPAAARGLPEGKRMGDNGRMLVGDKGFILGNEVYPESRAKEIGQIAKSIPRSDGHYAGMDPGVQRRQACGLEFRLGRPAGGVCAAGQRGPARASFGRT